MIINDFRDMHPNILYYTCTGNGFIMFFDFQVVEVITFNSGDIEEDYFQYNDYYNTLLSNASVEVKSQLLNESRG
jgi:hypothetical protein